MGALLETQAFYADEPGASNTAFTPASGDSLINRFFAGAATASLITFDRESDHAGYYRLRSPSMYDNVKGIHITEAAGQGIFSLQAAAVQPLLSQDTLILEGTGSTDGYDLVTLTRYYSNFAGSAMQLYSWGTIEPLIVNLYEVEIVTTSSATPTAWTDTVITTTENLLKANTDHAVIGYTCDVALGCIALKGSDTSSFRYGGPGIVNSPFTPNYFMRIGMKAGLPAIPVFNSANVNNTFVSTIDTGISTQSNVTLHIAQLARNLTT
jgi:hypothetical protein